MYRLIVESLLGLRREGETLHFAPCLPAEWPGFKIHYRYRETMFRIAVSQAVAGDGEPGVSRVTVDGVERSDKRVALIDDHLEHQVEVTVQA
jgi:cellobiose phosphorylase